MICDRYSCMLRFYQMMKSPHTHTHVSLLNAALLFIFETILPIRCLFSDGLVREDRYLDSGALQDFFVFFACQDRAGASRGVCFDYFVAILIRNDPPADFPWDKAVRDMQRFGIKPRDMILMYAGDGMTKLMYLFIINSA